MLKIFSILFLIYLCVLSTTKASKTLRYEAANWQYKPQVDTAYYHDDHWVLNPSLYIMDEAKKDALTFYYYPHQSVFCYSKSSDPSSLHLTIQAEVPFEMNSTVMHILELMTNPLIERFEIKMSSPISSTIQQLKAKEKSDDVSKNNKLLWQQKWWNNMRDHNSTTHPVFVQDVRYSVFGHWLLNPNDAALGLDSYIYVPEMKKFFLIVDEREISLYRELVPFKISKQIQQRMDIAMCRSIRNQKVTAHFLIARDEMRYSIERIKCMT